MKRLVAVHTKSNGWVKAFHKLSDGVFLVFGLNHDGTINCNRAY